MFCRVRIHPALVGFKVVRKGFCSDSLFRIEGLCMTASFSALNSEMQQTISFSKYN